MERDRSPTQSVSRRSEAAAAKASPAQVAAFVAAARRLDPGASGRLVFALDATMSRQPTWDRACAYQAAMFDAAADAGGLSVQLVYFRGYGECRASKWVMNAAALRELMTAMQCQGGHTQIGKVLLHAAREAGRRRVDALVYIGDAMEEDGDRLCRLAGELGVRGTKAFVFQEGRDRDAEKVFREIARLTGGAWFPLGPNSPADLAALLSAVATYARGGLPALQAQGGPAAAAMLRQLPGPAGGRT